MPRSHGHLNSILRQREMEQEISTETFSGISKVTENKNYSRNTTEQGQVLHTLCTFRVNACMLGGRHSSAQHGTSLFFKSTPQMPHGKKPPHYDPAGWDLGWQSPCKHFYKPSLWPALPFSLWRDSSKMGKIYKIMLREGKEIQQLPATI